MRCTFCCYGNCHSVSAVSSRHGCIFAEWHVLVDHSWSFRLPWKFWCPSPLALFLFEGYLFVFAFGLMCSWILSFCFYPIFWFFSSHSFCELVRWCWTKRGVCLFEWVAGVHPLALLGAPPLPLILFAKLMCDGGWRTKIFSVFLLSYLFEREVSNIFSSKC